MTEFESTYSAEMAGRRILVIRSCRVMLDPDLGEIYGVTTKALIQVVKRNIGRFYLTSCFN